MKKLMISVALLLILLLHIAPAFSKDSSIILYQSDGLTITETQATYRGKVIYDAITEPQKYGEDAEFLSYYYTPLSLVGPYFSYRCDFYDSGSGGCQYTTNFITVTTVNLETNQPVSVLDLIDEVSLVTALKKDRWVRGDVLDLKQLDSCRKLEEIIEVIGVCGREQIFFEALDPNKFYFAEFNRRTGLVALRLTRNEPLGCSSQNIQFELGLWVKPKKDVEKLFLQESKFNLGWFAPNINEPSGKIDNISTLIANYEKSLVNAINNGKFSLVEKYLTPGSSLYKSQKDLVVNLYQKKTQEKLVGYKIEKIKTTSKPNVYQVYVTEKIGIKRADKTDFAVSEFKWIYTVVFDGTKYSLSDIAKWDGK